MNCVVVKCCNAMVVAYTLNSVNYQFQFPKPDMIKILLSVSTSNRIQDSAIGYELDGYGVGVRVSVESRIFSSPCRLCLFLDRPSLLSKGCRSYSGVGEKVVGRSRSMK
jgi:hypothetical protein